MQNFISKLGHKHNMVNEKGFTIHLTKKCKACGENKPLSDFHNDKKAKDGKFSWCRDCRNEKQKNVWRNLSAAQKLKRSKKNEKVRSVTLSKWEPIIKSLYGEFKCQCCGKQLTFPRNGFGVNYRTSIYFDHKSNDIQIKGGPTRWLGNNSTNDKNIEIFKSCNFGMLCNICNVHLGSPNERERRVINHYNYVFGGMVGGEGMI